MTIEAADKVTDKITDKIINETTGKKIVYWHRELQPLDAVAMGEHVVEATSHRVPNTLSHREELWECYENLMANAHARIEQEADRLGGDFAHVLDESVDSRHDDISREAWLHGRFSYMLYKRNSS